MSTQPLLADSTFTATGRGGADAASAAPLPEDNWSASSSPYRKSNTLKSASTWLGSPFLLGALLAAIIPASSSLPPTLGMISNFLGWTYFVAWTKSFWPQILTNYRRKSVIGLSLDFQILNVLGFVSLSVYYSSLLWNQAVREEYSKQHKGQVPAVHANDVLFAVHALLATVVTLSQCLIYDRGGARPARTTIAAVSSIALMLVVWALIIVYLPLEQRLHSPAFACFFSWLTWLYVISYVKLGVSLLKYLPQAVLNYQRQSTVGFSIWQVLLDFEGGVLSLLQLLLDAFACSDWRAITGNPVKVGLGVLAILWDSVFIVQHYCLYPIHVSTEEETCLLVDDNDDDEEQGAAAEQ